ALKAGARRLGKQMDILNGDLTVTPELRAALNEARPILHGKTPTVTPEEEVDANPLQLEKSTPFTLAPDTQTLTVQEARNALSRLKYMGRVMARRGVDANGVTAYDVGHATRALEDVLYSARPDLQQLDRGYAKIADEARSVNRLLPLVQRSRATFAANRG